MFRRRNWACARLGRESVCECFYILRWPITDYVVLEVLDPNETIKYFDENTIRVMAILGSTYAGAFEGVKGMKNPRKS
jgi:hypothetical protein